MKTSSTRALIAALIACSFVVSAIAAKADPTAVEYLVQRKPLVATMQATDSLTFGFYSDAKCDTLESAVVLPASDSAIHYERVKSQRIGRVKGTDMLRIAAVIPDAPTGARFLRVDGPGVLPAKVICQPQPGAGSGLRFIDTEIADNVLAIAGVHSVDELRALLEKDQLPANVVCELLAEILAQGGTDIPVGVCGGGGDGSDPLDLLGTLIDLN